jgi:RNA polymerase sigma-70 factor, ECF subfamily
MRENRDADANSNRCIFDEKYLHALTTGNEDAEKHLISHFSRPVQLCLRARLRSPELVKDAYQETFLRVLAYFRSGKTLANPVSLPGFIQTICRNSALGLLRRNTRHDELPDDAPEPADTAINPEGQMVTEEHKGIVRQLLRHLPEKDRELLRRVFLDDEDKDSVCAEFRIDRNYLRVLLHRTRLRLKTTLSCTREGSGADGGRRQ